VGAFELQGQQRRLGAGDAGCAEDLTVGNAAATFSTGAVSFSNFFFLFFRRFFSSSSFDGSSLGLAASATTARGIPVSIPAAFDRTHAPREDRHYR